MGRLGSRLSNERLAGFVCGSRRERSEHLSSHPSYHIVESWDIEKMMEEPSTDYLLRPSRGAEDMRRTRKPTPTSLTTLLASRPFWTSPSCSGSRLAWRRWPWPKESSLATESGGTEVRLMRSVARRRWTFRPCARSSTSSSFLAALTGCGATCPAEYGHAAKVLGQWQKPGAEFSEGGLGSGATAGCKVLMTHGKSLTPAQQNWPPLIQEAICAAGGQESDA